MCALIFTPHNHQKHGINDDNKAENEKTLLNFDMDKSSA